MIGTEEVWWKTVELALSKGQKITTTTEEFDQSCHHIVQLLKDASLLLESGSHASSVFMSITAMEETAKIHIGMYRKSEEPLKRGKDPLYKHNKKHMIAASPTILMGSRLQNVIGKDNMHAIVDLAQKGELIYIREHSLYVERDNDTLSIPSIVITEEFAKNVLLFAVEVFDDSLVGYTSAPGTLSEETDRIFDKWSSDEQT